MIRLALGTYVFDVVTRFEGYAMSRVTYLNGCVQYGIQTEISDESPNKVPSIVYFDADRLEVVPDVTPIRMGPSHIQLVENGGEPGGENEESAESDDRPKTRQSIPGGPTTDAPTSTGDIH